MHKQLSSPRTHVADWGCSLNSMLDQLETEVHPIILPVFWRSKQSFNKASMEEWLSLMHQERS